MPRGRSGQLQAFTRWRRSQTSSCKKCLRPRMLRGSARARSPPTGFSTEELMFRGVRAWASRSMLMSSPVIPLSSVTSTSTTAARSWSMRFRANHKIKRKVSTSMDESQMLSLISSSMVFDLGQPLSVNSPHHPNYPPFTLVLQYRHGDLVMPCGMTFASSLIVTTDHHGTHVDAIGHVSRAHESAPQGPTGLTLHGIQTMPPVITRGVLLDVARARRVESLRG